MIMQENTANNEFVKKEIGYIADDVRGKSNPPDIVSLYANGNPFVNKAANTKDVFSQSIDRQKAKVQTSGFGNIKDSEIILTDDKQSQQLGSDFRIKSKTIFGDENFHVVDAKAATNYIKKIGEEPIPTFAMELMSLQRNNRRSGWVFETDEY